MNLLPLHLDFFPAGRNDANNQPSSSMNSLHLHVGCFSAGRTDANNQLALNMNSLPLPSPACGFVGGFSPAGRNDEINQLV